MAALIRQYILISPLRGAAALAFVLAAAAVAGCSQSSEPPPGPLPANVGYLRSSDNVDSSKLSQLVIFDADTFEIYRTVELSESVPYVTNRLAKDEYGRIWLSYGRYGNKFFPKSDDSAVLVFSPQGELLHQLITECGAAVNIVFANGRAFLLCPLNKVMVIDIDTMDIVKIIDEIAPPLEQGRYSFPYTLAVVDGVILVFGGVAPPETYQRVTNTSAGVAVATAIDTSTLEITGYHTGLQPGSRVKDALDVDGQAWMLNLWSHLKERPPRTDVYVMDSHTQEIVNSFNLPQPYPHWGRVAADGTIYIFHFPLSTEDYNAGLRPGFSLVDPETLEATFIEAGGVAELAFDWDQAMDVYRGRPCVTQRRSGLWCLNDDGTMTLEIEQLGAHGILFVPAGG